MNGWKEKAISEIVCLQRGHDLTYTNFEYGEYPVAGSNGIIGYHNKFTTLGPGITIGRSGNIGAVCYYENNFWAHNTTLYTTKFINSYPKFIFYLFKSMNFSLLNSGSAVPSLNRNFLYPLKVKVPNIEEQRAIATVLSNLDDKIDLLQRQNASLEAMAEALFKQWFVVEAKENWEEKKLGDFFPIRTGKKNSNYSTEDGKFPFFTCSKKVLFAPNYSFEGAAILLSGNGDFDVKRYNGKFEAYQRTYVLIPNEEKFYNFLYIAIKIFLNNITQGYRGSVINFITKGMIENFPLTMPRENIDGKLDQIDTFFSKIDANNTQISILEKLRDTLLPKLMSGEVRVALD